MPASLLAASARAWPLFDSFAFFSLTFLPLFAMPNFLPIFIISAILALFDIIPLLARRRPWRYNMAMYWQALITAIAIFVVVLPSVPWWGQGPLIATALLMPQLILPLVRGAYVWYVALLNAIVFGFACSLVKLSLADIGHFFAAAA